MFTEQRHLVIFSFNFIYLERMREGERMRGVGSKGEADTLTSWEPNVGLYPKTPGS